MPNDFFSQLLERFSNDSASTAQQVADTVADTMVTPTQLDNSNYDITDLETLSLSLDSLISRAGYRNTVGHYFADENGTPLSGVVDFANVKRTLGEGKKATYNYTQDEIPEGATQLGFFIIPNGFRQNRRLRDEDGNRVRLDDGDAVTFEQIDDVWTPILDGVALRGNGAPAYFSDQGLNPDGFDHVRELGDGQIGFEDLFGGGDQDFEDSVIDIEVTGTPVQNNNDGGNDNDDGNGGTGEEPPVDPTPPPPPANPGETIEGANSEFLGVERVVFSDVGNFELHDIDGDGVLDVVTHNPANNGLIWYSGTDGSFNHLTFSNFGTLGDGLKLVDYNGDGQLDIVTNAFGNLAWIDQNNQINYITFNNVGEFEVLDLNGDGVANEVLSIGGTYSSGAALANAGWYDASGNFNAITFNNVGDYALGDLDGDGVLELVSSGGTYQSGVAVGGIVSYELDGSGFARHGFLNAGEGFKIGNFDGDAADEILAVNASYNSGASITGAAIIEADGSFSRLTFNNIGEFEIADFNGDGIDDVVSIGGSYQNGVLTGGIALYDASGTFTRLSFTDISDFELSDFDGDGQLDILGSGGVFGNGVINLSYQGVNDSLVGTSADDTIIGGGGDDSLTGGAGADSFVFGDEFGIDIINDFEVGVDTLSFTSGSGVAAATDVLANATVTGGNTVITLAGEGEITLLGVDNLTENDIVIA